MTGHAACKYICIPRVLIIISSNLLFEFKRFQFSVCLSFTMIINKTQGQSLKVVGLDLLKPCFSQGILNYTLVV